MVEAVVNLLPLLISGLNRRPARPASVPTTICLVAFTGTSIVYLHGAVAAQAVAPFVETHKSNPPTNRVPQSGSRNARARLSDCRRLIAAYVAVDSDATGLWLDWFDRPYERASLAVALKTLRTLETLADESPADLDHPDVRHALDWLEKLPETIGSGGTFIGRLPPLPDRTLPDRKPPDVTVNGGTAILAIIDSERRSAASQAWGDLSLIAAAGFCGIMPAHIHHAAAATRIDSDSSAATVAERASALGLRVYQSAESAPTVIAAGPAASTHGFGVCHREARTERSPACWTPMTLHDWMTGMKAPVARDHTFTGSLRVADPPESWVAFAARCAAGRSLRPREADHENEAGTFTLMSWKAGRVPVLDGRARSTEMNQGIRDDAGAIRAALWLAAAEGMRLTFIENWTAGRLRPGVTAGENLTATELPNAIHPERIEFLAHAQLDLRRHAAILSRFRACPDVSVICDESALLSDDRWSPAFEAFLSELMDRQIFPDLYPAASPGAATSPLSSRGNSPYALTISWRAGQVEIDGTRRSVRRALAMDRRLSGRTRFQEPDGQTANRLFVRVATDPSPTICAINLGANSRSLVLRGKPGGGNIWMDALTGQRVDTGEPVAFAPWQVRLLISE